MFENQTGVTAQSSAEPLVDPLVQPYEMQEKHQKGYSFNIDIFILIVAVLAGYEFCLTFLDVDNAFNTAFSAFPVRQNSYTSYIRGVNRVYIA